jgi:hypothetical protein
MEQGTRLTHTSAPLRAQELEQVLLHPQPDDHLPLPLNGLKLAEADVELADALLRTPKIILTLLEDSLIAAQHAVMKHHPSREQMVVKENAHVRLQGLPPTTDPGCSRFCPSISAVGSRHIDQLVQVGRSRSRATCAWALRAGPQGKRRRRAGLPANGCRRWPAASAAHPAGVRHGGAHRQR